LPEPVKTWVLTAFTRSMDDVFLVAVPFMVVALIVAVTMREKPLTGRTHGPAARSTSEPSDADLVAMGH
ncbi:MAG TPA: MFS transporter, partial [Propionibacteriaceae bacterium]|nr:MFS transporter [Propionibacteriaceae bacterium]